MAQKKKTHLCDSCINPCKQPGFATVISCPPYKQKPKNIVFICPKATKGQ